VKRVRLKAKDPENCSKKLCACGGHSCGARKRRKAWRDSP
jgi:hypothetical protein